MTGERISEGSPEKSDPRECGEESAGESTGMSTAAGVCALVVWSGAGSWWSYWCCGGLLGQSTALQSGVVELGLKGGLGLNRL